MSGREQPERGPLAQLALANYPLKLFAVALSLALYVLVHNDQDVERTLEYDVLSILPPRSAERVLVSALPVSVRVTLRGPRSRIDALQPNDLTTIPLDLRDYTRPTFTFEPRLIEVPSRVQVVRVDPVGVEVRWRPRAERILPTRVQLVDGPQPGLVATVLRVRPATVAISGPDDEVASASVDAFTNEVSIASLGPGIYDLPAKSKPLAGHLVHVGVSATDVQIQIRPELPRANNR